LQIKTEFIGRDALRRKKKGLTRKLVGFEMIDKGIARDGFDVYIDVIRKSALQRRLPRAVFEKNIVLFCACWTCVNVVASD